MLVLSRRVGERVFIGENTSVTVLAIRGNQIRLGFSAPDSVKITREELLDTAPRNDPAIEPVCRPEAMRV